MLASRRRYAKMLNVSTMLPLMSNPWAAQIPSYNLFWEFDWTRWFHSSLIRTLLFTCVCGWVCLQKIDSLASF